MLKSILGKKVNSARDCIKGCRDTPCFTDCINSHWPGTTFEQLNSENLQAQSTPFEEDVHASTVLEQSDSITIDSAIAVETPSDTNNKEIVSALPQDALTKATNTMSVSNTNFYTVPLSDLPSLLEAPNISFTTGKICHFLFIVSLNNIFLCKFIQQSLV